MIIEKNNRWRDLLKQHHVAVWLCVSAAMMYSFLLVYRHVHLGYIDWDTAFYVQSLWNLLHGTAYSSLFDYHCFGGHAEFINLLVLPLFALFQHPLLFSFIEVVFFSLSAWLLYLMIEKDLDRGPALLITLAYLIFPANFFGMTHDICSESLTPFFFLTAVFFYRQKDLARFYVSIFFLLIIKENIPLIVMMFGLWGLTARDRDKMRWGGIPLAVALVYFIIVVKWVIPYFHGTESHPLWVRFRSFGATPEAFMSNIFRMETWAAVLFSPANINYIIALFGILLLPALLSPSILLLIAPILLYHLLSSGFAEKTIYYYYGLTLTPAIFLATAQTLKKFNVSRFFQWGISAIFLASTIFHLYSLSPVWMGKMGFYASPGVIDQWRLVHMIPADAPVIATFKFLPPLALRDQLYSFHKVYDRAYQDPAVMKWSDFNTNKIFEVPVNVQYALIDFDDQWLRACLIQDPAYARAKLRSFFKGWEPVAESGKAVLFQRD